MIERRMRVEGNRQGRKKEREEERFNNANNNDARDPLEIRQIKKERRPWRMTYT